VVVTGPGRPADSFEVGFDMNGQVTIPRSGAVPYCIRISDFTEPAIVRYVILQRWNGQGSER
jgi:hypothetical protein